MTVRDLDGGFSDGRRARTPENVRENLFEQEHDEQDVRGFGPTIVQGIAHAYEWTVRATESADGGAPFELTGVESA